MCVGIAMELQGIDLGDKRLNQRGVRVLEALAANPEVSINAACGGWNDTLAAYRFFSNPAVEPTKILEPHIAATRHRMRQHPVVLVVQDTTELDFSSHAPRDARCLDKEYRLGFYDHTYLAVTPKRLCLGVVGGEQYDRDPESLGKSKERKGLPIEQKESLRWLTGYRQASQLAGDFPNTQIVSVSDSESDIYDIFVEAEQLDGSADFIIRAKEDRCTPQRDPESGPDAYCKVRDEVLASEIRTLRTIELPQTPKRAARTACLEIRALRVTVKPPHARSKLRRVTYNVVSVTEINGPQDGTDVSWLLLTTLPIDTVEEILLVIDYYVARWTIEIFFRVLKTGCRVEEIQLETLSRVKNCLALYKIIAWRVLYLTYLNRECPEQSCEIVFDECEWQSVCQVMLKQAPPKKPPTLSTFMSLVAQLGGYNQRAQDPPPGPQVIWTGLRRMTDFAIAWNAFDEIHQPLMYK